MRYGKNQASFSGRPQHAQTVRFGLGIQVGGNFIQKQNRRIQHDRPGDGQQLPLSGRQISQLLNGSLQSLGQTVSQAAESASGQACRTCASLMYGSCMEI